MRPGRPGAVLRRRPGIGCLLASLIAVGPGCRSTTPEPEEITVFAAASLRDVLTELGARYQTERGGRIHFNFAGSNVLAQQLKATPAGDVFVSADEHWMDRVERAGRVVSGSRRTLLTNRLVVIARRDSPVSVQGPTDLLASSYRHLALGDPRAVPAGRYARAWLQSVRTEDETPLWDLVRDRVVPAAHVRAACAMVASRRDTIGVVYSTDAGSTPGVRVLYRVPPQETHPVRYAAALIARPRPSARAADFLAWLEEPGQRATFEEHGFVSAPGDSHE